VQNAASACLAAVQMLAPRRLSRRVIACRPGRRRARGNAAEYLQLDQLSVRCANVHRMPILLGSGAARHELTFSLTDGSLTLAGSHGFGR